MEKFLSLFWEFSKRVKKNGYFRTILDGLMLVFLGMVFYFTLNPEILFNRYTEYEEARHSQSFFYRMDNNDAVQNVLDKLILECNATRGVIVELHNGKYNAAGLSFNYGTVTYESTKNDTIENVREDYLEFSLDRYPMASKVYKEGYWEGGIEEIKEYDKRLALRLESNNAKYAAGSVIYGTKDEIGFLIVSYDNIDNVDKEELKKILNKYASKLSPLLDGEKAKQHINK